MRPLAAAVLTLAAQTVPAQPPRPLIRADITYVSTDVVVRDEHGQFAADLRRADFEVYEDGVKQEIAALSLTHGGRLITDAPASAAASTPGLLLPPPRPPSDASGRVFVIFVDDLHVDGRQTMAVRALLTRNRRDLLRPGDLVAMVSSGYSSIAVNLTYDLTRIDEPIEKLMGSGLKPSEIVAARQGAQGPAEVRHRANTAFRTVYDILGPLADVHDRRKTFIYISEGYDFDP